MNVKRVLVPVSLHMTVLSSQELDEQALLDEVRKKLAQVNKRLMCEDHPTQIVNPESVDKVYSLS